MICVQQRTPSPSGAVVGAHRGVDVLSASNAYVNGPVCTAHAQAAARGVEPDEVRLASSMPVVGALQAHLGDVPALITGVADPQSRRHAPDASLDIASWRAACEAEDRLLAELHDLTGGARPAR